MPSVHHVFSVKINTITKTKPLVAQFTCYIFNYLTTSTHGRSMTWNNNVMFPNSTFMQYGQFSYVIPFPSEY